MKLTYRCSLCWFEWHNGSILTLFSQICWNQQKTIDFVLIRITNSCNDPGKAQLGAGRGRLRNRLGFVDRPSKPHIMDGLKRAHTKNLAAVVWAKPHFLVAEATTLRAGHSSRNSRARRVRLSEVERTPKIQRSGQTHSRMQLLTFWIFSRGDFTVSFDRRAQYTNEARELL